MNTRHRATKPWNTASLAVYGALLGMSLGVMEQFCHAFCPSSLRHTPGGNLLTHVLIEVAIGAFVGATSVAIISTVRNWLISNKPF